MRGRDNNKRNASKHHLNARFAVALLVIVLIVVYCAWWAFTSLGSNRTSLSYAPLPSEQTSTKPLIVFFGGFFDERTENVKGWASSVRYGNDDVTTMYFGWADRSEAVAGVIDHLNEHPQSPVILVGHSYGGDTALNVASDLSQLETPVSVQLVVTLDPVSRISRGTFRGDLKSKNVEQWINVWTSNLANRSDVIAVIGGRWGECDEADENIQVDLSHEDSYSMFMHESVQTRIEEVIREIVTR